MKVSIDAGKFYRDHERLIHARVWHYAKKFNMEHSDLLSEANEIFCKAVEKWNPEKSKFTTYLYHSLRHLETSCKRQVDSDPLYNAREVSGTSVHNDLPVNDYTVPQMELYNSAATLLSKDAYKLISAILNGNLDPTPGRHKRLPSKYRARCFFGWSECYAVEVWNEVATWYQNFKSGRDSSVMRIPA